MKRNEVVVVGCQSGVLYKLFINNSFPNKILNHRVSIQYFQLDQSRELIMVVDSLKNLYLYNLQTQKETFSKQEVDSACFHSKIGKLFTYVKERILHTNFEGMETSQNVEWGEILLFSNKSVKFFQGGLIHKVDVRFKFFIDHLIKEEEVGKLILFSFICKDDDVL